MGGRPWLVALTVLSAGVACSSDRPDERGDDARSLRAEDVRDADDFLVRVEDIEPGSQTRQLIALDAEGWVRTATITARPPGARQPEPWIRSREPDPSAARTARAIVGTPEFLALRGPRDVPESVDEASLTVEVVAGGRRLVVRCDDRVPEPARELLRFLRPLAAATRESVRSPETPHEVAPIGTGPSIFD